MPTTTIHFCISESKYGIVIIHQTEEEVPKAVIMDEKNDLSPLNIFPMNSLSVCLLCVTLLYSASSYYNPMGTFLHKMSASIHLNSGKDNHFTNVPAPYTDGFKLAGGGSSTTVYLWHCGRPLDIDDCCNCIGANAVNTDLHTSDDLSAGVHSRRFFGIFSLISQ